jgi:membrane associated rhomboid family serine protease
VVDVCRPCNFVWFDWQEVELPPAGGREIPIPAASARQAARELAAIQEVKEIARAGEAFDWDWNDWRTFAAIFGMPVELDRDEFTTTPLATWCLAVVIVVVSVAAFFDLDRIVTLFGMVPAEAGRLGGLTLITTFFLHAGWGHLLGNLYFFITFGDNVEAHLGHRRFVVLLLSATIAGAAFHIAVNPGSMIPCVGASGGISGVLAFYALKFPGARLGWLFWLYLVPRMLRIPAWGWFAIWMLLQLVGLSHQMSGVTRVSAAAHLGGVAAGVCCWALWRNRLPTS